MRNVNIFNLNIYDLLWIFFGEGWGGENDMRSMDKLYEWGKK